MSSISVFRRVSVLAAVFAYLQIALGGLVRVSGSGLGCPDWPLCHGRPYPPANVHAIIEYSHRTVGTITGLLIIATVAGAWLVYRSRRPLVAWVATASLVAVAAEGALGGVVVVHELQPWLVAIHLGLAMIILGSLIATAVMSMPETTGASQPVRRLTVAAVGVTYVLLLTGSTVVASDADAQCHSWPLCGGGLTPDFNGVNAFTMLHRGFALAAGIFLVYFLWVSITRGDAPGMRPFAIATAVALAVQVAVGAASALSDAAIANGLHVALASLVWAGVCTTAFLAVPRSDRASVTARARMGTSTI